MQSGLTIKPNGTLDFVSIGALVHRLDPGIVPFRKATECQIHVSGGEFNVAANLSDCFRLNTAVVTAMVDYPIGDLIAERVRAASPRYVPATAPDDLALFQYTSGTTRALPEAVRHTHRAVVTLMVAALYGVGLQRGDRYFSGSGSCRTSGSGLNCRGCSTSSTVASGSMSFSVRNMKKNTTQPIAEMKTKNRSSPGPASACARHSSGSSK